MSWVRLDDGYPEHPKVDQVGPLAAWLNVCAWAYCARNLTDGFIPGERVSRLASVKNPTGLADKLVAARLWECVEGGFQVHDYLAYNPSREQVMKDRAHAAERMRSARSSGEHPAKFNGSSVNPGPGPAPKGPGPVVNLPDPAREPGPDGPLALPNGARQCPLCPEIFTTTYDEHLSTSTRHKVRAEPEDFGRSHSPHDDQPAEGPALNVDDAVRSEHERLQALERARK